MIELWLTVYGVITPLPEGWGICLTCEALISQVGLEQPPQERGLEEYPPEWREDFRRFSETMLALSERFGSSVQFLIWDPRSLQGLIKAIRFGVRRYPAFVVNQAEKIVGLDFPRLEQALLSAGGRIDQEQFIIPQL